MPLYFAYGSNLDRVQMARRCPTSHPICRAELPEHRLAFTGPSAKRGRGVATVLRDRHNCTPGVLYALSTADVRALDGYEGHPWAYRRVELDVFMDDGRLAKAWTYIKRDTSPCPPGDGYFGIIRAAYTRLGFDVRDLKDALHRCRDGRKLAICSKL